MTIVAAYNAPDGIYIGCDSRETSGGFILLDDTPKVFHGLGLNKDILVGISGARKIEKLVTGGLRQTVLDDDGLERFCRQLRDDLELQLWERDKSDVGGPPLWNLSLVLTNGTVLYEVGGTLGIREIPLGGITTIGASYEADGVLWAMKQLEKSPAFCVWTALRAACRFRSSCGGVLRVYRIEPRGFVSMINEPAQLLKSEGEK